MTWQIVNKDSCQVTVGVGVTGIDVSITLRDCIFAQHVPHILRKNPERYHQVHNKKPAIDNKKPARVPQAKQVQA